MGLDMRLSRKHYVQNWDHQTPEEKHTITVTGPKADEIDTSKIIYIEEEVTYWRKANAIHQFFVDKCNDGNDDRNTYYVSPSVLRELLSKCQLILDNCELVKDGDTFKLTNQEFAEEILPTQSGFFFGSTEYDEWYYEDILATKQVLAELIKNPKWEHPSYYYDASW